jgi:hypothetical protein
VSANRPVKEEKMNGGPVRTRTSFICVAALLLAVLSAPAGARAQLCAGDCNRDGLVSINELITAVNIALGNSPLSGCRVTDLDGNGRLEVNELIAAVNDALAGCPSAATPTPTRTPEGTPGTPGVARPAAAALVSHLSLLSAIPRALIGVFAYARRPGEGSAAATAFDFPVDCPLGGSTGVRCDEEVFEVPLLPPSFRLTADACAMAGPGGSTLTTTGEIRLDGTMDAACGPLQRQLQVAMQDLEVETAASAGGVDALFDIPPRDQVTLELTGTDAQCQFEGATLTLTGTLRVDTTEGGGAPSTITATFANTTIELAVDQFGPGCVPQIYQMTLHNAASLSSGDWTFDATYLNFHLEDDLTSGHHVTSVSGSINSSCFGEILDLDTASPLELTIGEACPRSGEVMVTSTGGTDAVRYQSDESVDIHLAAGGTDSFPSCLDPALFTCP